jgi:hypothetical protein
MASYRYIPSVFCEACAWSVRVGSAGDICDMHSRTGTLAHNLAIAGALCWAFGLGWADGYREGAEREEWTWERAALRVLGRMVEG